MGRVASQDELEQDDFVIPQTIGDPLDNDDLLGEDEDEDDDDVDPMLSALQEQMEQLKTTQQEERTFFQNLMTQVAQPQQQQQQETAAPEFNVDDLPDPVEDRTGFNKALATKVNAFVKDSTEQTAAAVMQQSNQNQGVKDLEQRFLSQHPDLAKKSALFTAVVTQETNKLRNRGLDVRQFVFADPDKFLTTVAAEMKAELGMDDSDDDLDDDDTRTVRKPVGGKRKSRAKGVRGGSTPALKKSKSRGKKATGFVAELKRQQSELGIV